MPHERRPAQLVCERTTMPHINVRRTAGAFQQKKKVIRRSGLSNLFQAHGVTVYGSGIYRTNSGDSAYESGSGQGNLPRLPEAEVDAKVKERRASW